MISDEKNWMEIDWGDDWKSRPSIKVEFRELKEGTPLYFQYILGGNRSAIYKYHNNEIVKI